jgi:iron complex transport system substrate-binding protein
MRIVSLLPAGAEIVCALGLGEALVGVSHECAYPPQVIGKPAVTRGLLPVETMTQAQIDAEMSRRLAAGEPIYEVDGELLARLAPDLVITQDLCEVCAASPKDLSAALAGLARRPRVLQLTPHSLDDILGDIVTVGEAAGRPEAAAVLVQALRARIEAVRTAAARAARRPRVFCMEWIDPPYGSGHWVPEMVEICGGIDALSRRGEDSVRIPWSAVLDWAPEVLVVMACGYGLEAAVGQAQALPTLPGWADLPAVRQGRAHVVDANSYFACPGPRVVDGLELLASLVHPDLFAWSGPQGAVSPLRTKACARCGGSFSCRPEPGCWCEAEPLPAGTAKALGRTYADCLCPRCLPAAARAAWG